MVEWLKAEDLKSGSRRNLKSIHFFALWTWECYLISVVPNFIIFTV